MLAITASLTTVSGGVAVADAGIVVEEVRHLDGRHIAQLNISVPGHEPAQYVSLVADRRDGVALGTPKPQELFNGVRKAHGQHG
jgi:hypothetical protein